MRNMALLWDESHLWGILLWRALTGMGQTPRLLSAENIRRGALQDAPPDILLVPGGWARFKAMALSGGGRENIRRYVLDGGGYFGICGGAGLALASQGRTPLLDLCSWSRRPARERLPNFSGHMCCRVREAEAESEALLPVWWPSQFAPAPEQPLEILASYEAPGPDFWSADLSWSAVNAEEAPEWEAIYGINLDPRRLRGEPCVVRGTYGRGWFILSYAHLESPASYQANNLLARLLGVPQAPVPDWSLDRSPALWNDPRLAAMQDALEDLILFGQNHFLFVWRTPWLLGWRRGVPGSPVNFLLALVWQARHTPLTKQAHRHWEKHGDACARMCAEFCCKVRTYLVMERRILALAPSSPESSASDALQGARVELFGQFPGYGGIYGELLRPLDKLLWLQLADVQSV